VTIKKKSCIGIIVAVPEEGGILTEVLGRTSGKNYPYYKGKLAGRPVVLAVSGLGKVNAAHAATRMIHDHAPSLIMNIGVGGAYPSAGLGLGDIAIAEKEYYGDEGVLLKDGFHGTDLIGIPLLKRGRRKYFNEFPLDRRLVRKAVMAFALRPLPFAVLSGPFVTMSTCSGTMRRARDIEKKFHAVCENMEGAAIAHVSALYGIPVFEMRGISNMVGDRDRAAWDIGLAAEHCQAAARELLRVV
jgi:futalosine hydrolase